MADQKLTALSAWTPALASLAYVVDDPAGSPVSRKATFTEIMALMRQGFTFTAGGADAAQTMAVGTIYYTDISGYTADRTYTLPATAAVGDMCGIVLTAGDTAFELLTTAASGDTLIGSMGSIAGGTEYTRLFIAGETMLFLCVAANSTWVVLHDGRIPQNARMAISTNPDGETANTVTLPTDAGGAWTASAGWDNASIITTATGRFTTRRACKMQCIWNAQGKDTLTTATITAVVLVSGTERGRATEGTGTAVNNCPVTVTVTYDCVADDYIQPAYASSPGGIGLRANTSVNATFLELL